MRKAALFRHSAYTPTKWKTKMVNEDFDTSQEIDEGITESDAEALGNLFEDDEPADEVTDEPTNESAENDEDTPDTDELEGGEVEDQEQVIFADESHRVKLADGTETTVHELTRGNLREADYTQKTMKLSQERDELQQFEQKLNDARNIIDQVARANEPQKPRRSDPEWTNDPYGFDLAKDKYEEDKEAFDQNVANLQQQQLEQQQQSQWQEDQYLKQEYNSLITKNPEFSDGAKLNEYWSQATKVMGEYGFTPEESARFTDHRFVPLMKAAMELKQIKAKRSDTVKDIQSKPKMVKGSNRKSNRGQVSKNVQSRISAAQSSGNARDVSDILGKLLEG